MNNKRSLKKIKLKSDLLKSIKQVFIINLKHRTDRKKIMTERLKMINIPKNKITFIEATDRSEESWARALSEIYGFNISNPLDYINKKYLKKIKSPNEKTRLKAQGEIAVFLSHFRIWSIVSNIKEGSYLVFEDDAIPKPILFNSSTDTLFNKVKEVPFIFLGYLYPDCSLKNSLLEIKSGSNSLFSCFVEALHAYVIRPSFGLLVKGSLLSKDAYRPLPISEPVDHFVPNFLLNYDIPFYVYKKPLFDQDLDLGTDIQGYMDKDKKMFEVLNE